MECKLAAHTALEAVTQGMQQVTENSSCTGKDDQAAPIMPNKKQKREAKEAKPPRALPEPSTSHQGSPDLGPPPEPTEYVKNRPRRETGRAAMALGHTSESLELVKCCDFVGPPGSGAPLAQPFQVEVDAQVHCCLGIKSAFQK